MVEKEIKRNLNKMVEYDGKRDVYMLIGAMICREVRNGPFFYQALLADTTADSTVWTGLENVGTLEGQDAG